MSFLSAEAKRQFTWKFGLMIAAFFVLQFLVPGILFLVIWFSMMKSFFNGFQLENALLVKNQTYLLGSSRQFFDEMNPEKKPQAQPQAMLYKLDQGKKMIRIKVPAIPMKIELALSDGNYAWLFYGDHCQLFDGKSMRQLPFACKMGEDPIGTVGGGKIHVIYQEGGKHWWTAFDMTGQSAPMELPGYYFEPPFTGHRLLFYDGKLWRFTRAEGDVFVETIAEDGISELVKLGAFPCDQYLAGYDPDGMFVAGWGYCGSAFPGKNSIKLARIDAGGLKPIGEFYAQEPFVQDISSAAFLFSGEKRAKAFYSGFGPSVQVKSIELSTTQAVTLETYQEDVEFPKAMVFMPLIYATPVLLALVLSLLASRMMPRYRTTEIVLAGKRYEFASAFRRAVSQIIDLAVLLIPGAAIYYGMMVSMVKNIESPFAGLGLMLVIFIVWAGLALAYFVLLEGWFGITLGKRIMGIQALDEEGKPPGLGRAMLRNLLKVVDGFFNFIIGIALIAFTDNWQRVGDLAARTVVVRRR